MNIENRHVSVWGDSIMKGIVLDASGEKYQVLDENCVARFAAATGVEVTNHASFGMTTGKAYERIQRSIEREPPAADDIVVIEFGGNDCDYNWAEISAEPDRHHEPKTPIAQFGDRLQSIVDAFVTRGLSPILVSLPPLEPNRYFEWLSRGLDKMNILKWLGDVNKIYRWQEAYNDILTTCARRNDLRLIDARKSFLVSERYGSLVCADGIHPNRNGHEVLYSTFLDYLECV